MLGEKLTGINMAAFAVADAMMVAHAKLLSDVIDSPEKYLRKNVRNKTRELERVVEEVSKSECGKACSAAASFLAKNHKDLFSGIAILEALGGIKDLINPSWSYHRNFLVLDKSGVWYAGSPAGYRKDYGDNQRFTRVITSKNVEEILARITYEDEGLWPTADFVKETFANYFGSSIKPSSKKNDGVVIINLGGTQIVKPIPFDKI